VHEINLKGVHLQVLFLLEEMVLGGHVVALVPVGFPLTKDWETWFNVEVYVLICSISVRSTDVANVVIVIESVDVLGQEGSKRVDGILSMVWVDMGHIINSRELSIDTSGLIVNFEVLINRNRAPVRNKNVSFGLLEVWERKWVNKEELDLVEGDWSYVIVGTVDSEVSVSG